MSGAWVGQMMTHDWQESVRQQAIASLKEWQKMKDPEPAHAHADKVLCDLLIQLGYGDVVAEWHKVEKWYA